jgi:hypothetical protein
MMGRETHQYGMRHWIYPWPSELAGYEDGAEDDFGQAQF